jgi:hypothetical protein
MIKMPILRKSVRHRSMHQLKGIHYKALKIRYSFKNWGLTFNLHKFLCGAKVAICISYFGDYKNIPYSLYMSEIL